MRKKTDFTLTRHKRISNLHAPMRCEECKKNLEVGDDYFKRGSYSFFCEGCILGTLVISH